MLNVRGFFFRKISIFAIVLSIILAIPVYADSETESRRSFVFSTGFYTNQSIHTGSLGPISNFYLDNLTIGKISGNLELPLRFGYATFGMEFGFSSGSLFGGSSHVDLFPISLTTAYYYPLLNNLFYIGPRLNLGGIYFRGPDWSSIVPLIGARLDLEFRIPYLPVSIYGAFGADMFPTVPGMFPVFELGLRFPRRTQQRPSTQPSITQFIPSETTRGELVPSPTLTPEPTPDPEPYIQDIQEPIPPVTLTQEPTLDPEPTVQEIQDTDPQTTDPIEELTLEPTPEPEVTVQEVEEITPTETLVSEPTPEPEPAVQEPAPPVTVTLEPTPEPDPTPEPEPVIQEVAPPVTITLVPTQEPPLEVEPEPEPAVQEPTPPVTVILEPTPEPTPDPEPEWNR